MLRRISARLMGMFRRDAAVRDLNEQLAHHLEMLRQRYEGQGLPPAEALRRARLELGAETVIHEQVREQHGFPRLEHLWQDARFGLRMLRRNPGFALTAILTLALGIGANTAIFTVVNSVLIRPLPYAQPEQLISLEGRQSWPDLDDIRQQSRLLEKIGACWGWQFDLLGSGEPEKIEALFISLDLFDTLGVRAELGRTFSGKEDVPGGAKLVVLSHGFWQKKMGGDPGAIGRTLTLSGDLYTVVGVMPAEFRLPIGDPELFVPFRVGYPEAAAARGLHAQFAMARLRPGATLPELQSELDGIARSLARLYPEENRHRRYVAMALQQRIVRLVRPTILMLFGAVNLVLMIAALNFAGLLLARSTARTAEAQVRAALGATPARLASQFLTESLLVALLGGGAGVALGEWMVRALVALRPLEFDSLRAPALDWRVLAFAAAVSLLTGVVCGLVPVLRHLLPRWRSATLGSKGVVGARTHGGQRLRRSMIVAQLAISLVLLCGSGLLLRSLWHLQNVATGFTPEGVLTARIWLPEKRYADIQRQDAFFAQLEQNLRSIPGVSSAALVTELPLSGNLIPHNFVIAGRPALPVGTEPEAATNLVSADYFSTLGIPILRGRAFTQNDNERAPLVAMVNSSLTRRYFAGQDPIGAQVRFARDPKAEWLTIVGVAADVKELGPDQDQDAAIYTPILQKQEPWRRWSGIVVRTAAVNPLAVSEEVKKAVWAVDSKIPVTKILPVTELLSGSLAPRRSNTLLLCIFAAVALTLTTIGVYGVISYNVLQRTPEIGLRLALGAGRARVLWLVLRQGLIMAASGAGLGLVGTLAGVRYLRSQLFGVSQNDPVTLCSAAIVLTGIAAVAALIPAARATAIDPIEALRYE